MQWLHSELVWCCYCRRWGSRGEQHGQTDCVHSAPGCLWVLLCSWVHPTGLELVSFCTWTFFSRTLEVIILIIVMSIWLELLGILLKNITKLQQKLGLLVIHAGCWCFSTYYCESFWNFESAYWANRRMIGRQGWRSLVIRITSLVDFKIKILYLFLNIYMLLLYTPWKFMLRFK